MGGYLKIIKLATEVWGTNDVVSGFQLRVIILDFHDDCNYRFTHIFLNLGFFLGALILSLRDFSLKIPRFEHFI